MAIGSIGYQCHSGLGHLMLDFFQHGVVDYVLLIPHSHYPNYDWYPADKRFTRKQFPAFLDRIQTLLLFENAFNWEIVAEAKRRNIRVVLIPNYEYSPFPPPVTPDLVICAALLDRDYYKDFNHCLINMPVEQKWGLRSTALTFVHNAGHGQRGFAKGTPEIVKAMEYVQSPVRLRITGQPGEKRIQELFQQHKDNPRLELVYGDLDRSSLFSNGDVFINAEQYNGMSLMLQEAYAAGMLVISTDRYPMNTWLPKQPLIPVKEYVKDRICVEFDRAIVDSLEIAARIDEFYGSDITSYSIAGREWAAKNSWEVLKPRFMEALS